MDTSTPGRMVVAVVKVLSLKKTRSGLSSCWNVCSGGQ